jgi:hypothetical protein
MSQVSPDHAERAEYTLSAKFLAAMASGMDIGFRWIVVSGPTHR